MIDSVTDVLIEAGRADILVANAGGPSPGAAADAKREDGLGHFETMAANIFHLTRRLLPGMHERG